MPGRVLEPGAAVPALVARVPVVLVLAVQEEALQPVAVADRVLADLEPVAPGPAVPAPVDLVFAALALAGREAALQPVAVAGRALADLEPVAPGSADRALVGQEAA